MRFYDDSAEIETFDTNVIPLIDILLVLLIFFMTSSSFIASGGIDVKLPKASQQRSAEAKTSLVVSLGSNGKLSLEKEEMTIEQLPIKLKERLVAGEAAPTVILRADEKAEHGLVVSVLDAIKGSGINEVGIAAVPKGNR